MSKLSFVSLLISVLWVSMWVVSAVAYTDVTVSEAKDMIDTFHSLVILDVRSQDEYDAGHIRNAKLIPSTELESRLDELNPTATILVYCKLGGRSATASQTLVDNGFLFIYNMLGGITAWINEGYPVYVNYSSIQEAINNANEGDALYISSATYYETIIVNKAVSLIGENPENTIINGSSGDTTIIITAGNSSLQNFQVESTEDYNIAVSECRNISIAGNQLVDGYGILTEQSENTTIEGNNIMNCSLTGISLVNSINSKVVKNAIWGVGYAITLENSSMNLIEDNSIFDSDFGIDLADSNQNVIRNNVISDFHFEDLHAGSGIAISLASSNNTVINNEISKMSVYGIIVNQSSSNFLIRNSILNNGGQAILFQLSNTSLIDGNLIQNNEQEGLTLDRSNLNHIYHNSFVSNNNHTFLINSSDNRWDNGYPSGGNYWDDYNGTDYYNGPFQNETGSDDIGDMPYHMDESNQDRYPLMKPNRLRWDLTGDGYVGIDDIVAVAEHFGEDPLNPQWDLIFDVTGDNYVGIDDIVAVAEHFGEAT